MFVGLLIAIFVSAIAQGILVLGFVMQLRNWRQPLLADSDCPHAAVILCLRGGDPFLARTIAGIKSLDYPNYDVLFVVDSRTDPCLSTLEPFLSQGWSNASIIYLDDRLTTCSLKCSSLLTAIRHARIETNFIASIDADTVPHVTWLRELATALQGTNVGAATGNRWYMPDRATKGARIRHVWNAAAIVQMYWYGIAWGGTLAIKMDTIRQANLLDKWSHSLCEDTMLKRQLGKIGLRVAFVPGLMMINRESCSLGGFYSWVKRQLLTARLYHPLWLAVVGHGISSALLLLTGWGYVAICLLSQRWNEGLSLLATLVVFHAYLCVLIPMMERPVSAIARARGEADDWAGNTNVWQLCLAVWETQWIYTAALCECLFMKRVEWRGVEYDVRAPFDLELRKYSPFEATKEQPENMESL